MAEAPRALERDEAELVLDSVLAAAGPGRYLVCGPNAAQLARALLARGIEATHSDTLAPPAAASRPAYDVAILWHVLDAMDPARAAAALEALRPAVAHAVAVRTDSRSRPRVPRGDTWIEQPAFDAGYRKHPLYLQLWPYEARESAGPEDFLLLEPIAARALERHPLASLAAERDLHMDMLREAGRRSDAHVERYRLALQFVRPGDTVLDVACGMGYGSRTLFAGSAASLVIGLDESASAVRYATDNYGSKGHVEFHRGDAQDLGFLADASVDLVVTFETLEHLDEPMKLVREASRVLRPGGRIVACIPNQWVDESGNDPNPHHHHVYTWERLRDEIGSAFRVERAYRQIAGAGMTHTASPRVLREFAPREAPGAAEWLIVAAMKDPVAAAGVGYVESTFVGYEGLKDFHVARFDRDYDNPWLVKAMVSIGYRFGPRDGLREISREVLAQARPGSADAGAALCVEAYALLEAGAADAGDRARMRKELDAYVAKAGGKPHERRWAISCLYAKGLLALADARREEALAAFEGCAAMDPGVFSPLLATKTIGAAYMAGLLRALSGDEDRAREWWTKGIAAAREVFGADWTNVVGRADHPLFFGLPEVAGAVARASRCAFALGALEDLKLRPGRFWVEVLRDPETQAERQTRSLRHTLRALEGATRHAVEASAGAAAAEELQSALDQQAVTIGDMNRAFEEQAATIARMTGAFDEQAATIARMTGAFDEQARNIASLNKLLAERDASFKEQAAEIARQREAFGVQATNIAQLRQRENEREAALAEQARTLAQNRVAFETQARNIEDLRAQAAAREQTLATQRATLEEMHAKFAQQAATIEAMHVAFADQASNIEALREKLAAAGRELAQEHARLEEAGAARDRLAERLGMMRGTWPYRLLGRWMEERH